MDRPANSIAAHQADCEPRVRPAWAHGCRSSSYSRRRGRAVRGPCECRSPHRASDWRKNGAACVAWPVSRCRIRRPPFSSRAAAASRPDDEAAKPLDAPARIDRIASRNKNIPPRPGGPWRRILSLQRVWQKNARFAGSQIILENQFPPPKVLTQISAYFLRQHRHPIPGALAVTDAYLSRGKIDILYAQANPVHQTHSGAVQQTREQAADRVHPLQHALHFAASEDDRQALGGVWLAPSRQARANRCRTPDGKEREASRA